MFKFNECQVCINPEIAYSYEPKGVLAWAKVEIKVCQFDGKWDFGYWYLSGCGPCTSYSCLYDTKEEAIFKGIQFLSEYFARTFDIYGVSAQQLKEFKQHFNQFKAVFLFKNECFQIQPKAISTPLHAPVMGTQLMMF